MQHCVKVGESLSIEVENIFWVHQNNIVLAEQILCLVWSLAVEADWRGSNGARQRMHFYTTSRLKLHSSGENIDSHCLKRRWFADTVDILRMNVFSVLFLHWKTMTFMSAELGMKTCLYWEFVVYVLSTCIFITTIHPWCWKYDLLLLEDIEWCW